MQLYLTTIAYFLVTIALTRSEDKGDGDVEYDKDNPVIDPSLCEVMALYHCGSCSRSYQTTKSLREHIQRAHGEVGRCPHPECGFIFPKSRQDYLRRHRERVHRVLSDGAGTEKYSPRRSWKYSRPPLKKRKNSEQDSVKEQDSVIKNDFSEPDSNKENNFSPISSPETVELFPVPPIKIVSSVEQRLPLLPVPFPAGLDFRTVICNTPVSPVSTCDLSVVSMSSSANFVSSVTTVSIATLPSSLSSFTNLSCNTSTVITTPVVTSAVVSSTPLDLSTKISTPSAQSVNSVVVRASTLLAKGGMPLFPPALRLWDSDEAVLLTSKPYNIYWPPKNWKLLDSDQKLFVLEHTSSLLEIHVLGGNFLNISRVELLDKFNFLRLAGTAVPHSPSHDAGRHMRYFNYSCLRTLSLTGEDKSGILPGLEASSSRRISSTDIFIDIITAAGIPLRLQ